MKQPCECVTWVTLSRSQPQSSICTMRSIPPGVSETLIHSPSQGTAPPPEDLVGPSKGKSFAKDTPPWGWAGALLGDNSLLRKHHVLILDLPVQGQDVIIDEWALQVKTQRKDVGPGL